jgi:hypothetical protein
LNARYVARAAIAALFVWAAGCVLPARVRGPARRAFALDSYVQRDGAITVYPNGAYVEPYFAMRALSTAADLGADVDSLARGYIAWQLARFEAGLGFSR